MDCSTESLKIDMGVVVGVGDTTNNVSGICNQCLNLESKIKTIENTCSTLQQEIGRERNEFTLLEGKFEALRVEKLAVENELEVLKRRNQELEERMRQIDNNNGSNEENEEEDKVLQLMIENSVLECEKRKAECDVEYWKSKCNELQLTVAELDKKMVSKAGDRISRKKSLAKTPSVQAKLVGGNKGLLSESGNNQVRKRLTFEEERGSNKRVAPSTPAGIRPTKVVVIDINDSDDERTTSPCCTSVIGSDYETSVPLCTPPIPGFARSEPYCGSRSTLANIELPSESNIKMTGVEQFEDSDMVCHNKEVLYVPTPKRRRASNIIASDSDTDEDDDKVPICMLKTRHFREKCSDDHPRGHSTQTSDSEEEVRKLSSRRRLVKLSQCEGKGGGGNDIEEDVSDSEGESLGGFIVSSSDISDDDDISNSDGALQSNSSVAEDSISDLEYISESDSDYGEIMSKIRRNKNDLLEWEFEGDMLAAFGMDPELCMKAVCVLYRQQMSEEQCSKETIFHNQRGFSQCDAFRYVLE
ncbi:hypothetical protein RND71_018217 [Anisodus tanguticus]|uniref:Uncharacterized protein n=1 Tax=Anisodus tanguticus TaxID=243964 RepID=A0AAE1S5P6_9SOLA|nr:hypothetical protein RND71_018217 [Anisodus tanguticus]